MATNSLPPRPDLVLRLGFAGSRTLPEDPAARARLESALGNVFAGIAENLTDLPKRRDAAGGAPPTVTRFYSSNRPLVRLISGLAEGADDLAIQTMTTVASKPQTVRFESAGVLAFPHDKYLASREPSFQDRFEALYRGCAYVLELDGIYDATNDSRRQRAYRAQTTVLLRQSDLFVAMTDASGTGKAGGTHEAVRAALALGLAVVLIDTAHGTTQFIGPDEDVDEALTRGRSAASAAVFRDQLRKCVATVLADPDTRPRGQSTEDHVARQTHAAQLLEEFFHEEAMPPATGTFREWLWVRLDGRYSSHAANARAILLQKYTMNTPQAAPDPAAEARRVDREKPYQAFRTRASKLTGHYAGLYRGAFLLNYGLAAVAVGLAAVSLVILAVAGGTTWLLLGLGVIKLIVVLIILFNTRAAKKHRWNERAVDYRYLAERLRTMLYLPGAGGFQLAPAAPGYSSRVVRQSAADWLFDAIVRHVSPHASRQTDDPSKAPFVFEPDPSVALRLVRDGWLYGQAEYHQNNADKMHAMFTAMERLGHTLNVIVIGFVCADLLVLLAGVLDLGPHILHAFTPWLVFFAALLPVAVAAVNGIRFQSECQRLAERSRVMVEIVAGRWKEAGDLDAVITQARADDATNPGSWTPAVLRLAESIAIDMMNETAEWSVLYGKEIVET